MGFDDLFATGRTAILGGSQRRDTVPVEGGRWPVSVVLEVPAALREELHRHTSALVDLAGPDHFRTGDRSASHLTLRALEPFRAAAAAEDPLAGRVSTALDSIADHPPVDLEFTGLTLSPAGVLGKFESVGFWTLRDRLVAALDTDAWYEADLGRDIVYATLLHFTGDIAEPERLVAHVADRRDLTPSSVRAASVGLCRFRHDPDIPAMVPEIWHRTRLAG